MTDRVPTSLAPPRIVSHAAMLIFGMSRRYARTNAGMAEQWKRFMPYIGHIPAQFGHATYGVVSETAAPGAIDYITGVEVSSFPSEPKDFARLRVPAQTYAVFWHADHVSTVSTTWEAIWEGALSEANLHATTGPNFERYDDRFDPHTGQGGFEIWVAVGA